MKSNFLLKAFYLLLLVFLSADVFSQDANTPVVWRIVGDDLKIAKVKFSPKPLFYTEMLFLKTTLKRYRVGVILAEEFGRDRASAKFLCQKAKAVACINANFFDTDYKPLGLVIKRGIKYNPMHKEGQTLTGVFSFNNKQLTIINRSALSLRNTIGAVQAGPRLISNGKALSGLREKSSLSRRSGVCIDKNNHLIFYAVSSGLLGISIQKLQELLLHPRIACQSALNLDGGGSTQFYMTNKLSGAPEDFKDFVIYGRDDVPVALGLFPTS